MKALEGEGRLLQASLDEGTVDLETASPHLCRRLEKVLATSKDVDDGTESML